MKLTGCVSANHAQKEIPARGRRSHGYSVDASVSAESRATSTLLAFARAPSVSSRCLRPSVRPTKTQRSSLEALQKKSFEMGQFLMASCLKPMPATPAERLDAAADRLTAVIFAASNLNMALNDFTSQLSDDQKTRLNSMVR